MWYPIFVVSLWEVISSNKSCIISILPCAVTHHFFPHPLSLSSLHSHHFSLPSTLFSHLNPHQFFISLPPSLSFSLSHHFHSPLLSLFPPPPPPPPVFTSLPLSLSLPTTTILHSPPTFSFPTPLVLTFLPLSLLPPPLSYPPNCQYTLAYGLNDLCTEVSAELFKAGFK